MFKRRLPARRLGYLICSRRISDRWTITNKMSVVLDLIFLILNVLNITLHGTGFYLLLCLYRNGMDYSRHLLLMNLSLIEGLSNFVDLLQTPITDLIVMPREYSLALDHMRTYIRIVYDCMFGVLYHLAMIYIVADRFMDIYLNIKYPTYWSLRKTRYLLRATWTLAFLFGICACVLYKLDGYDLTENFSKYFTPVIDITFVMISIATYTFIFSKFKQTRLSPSNLNTNWMEEDESMRQTASSASSSPGTSQTSKTDFCGVFRRSKFYISVLLISSFVIFIVVPDLLNVFVFMNIKDFPNALLTFFLLCNSVSDLLDGYIYIFIQGYVRKLLWKKLKKKCVCLRGGGSSSERSYKDRVANSDTEQANISVVSANF